MTGHTSVVKGQRYTWTHGATPDMPIDVLVTRVAADQSWADIVCTDTLGVPWRKRQPLPFPQGMKRQAQ
jgi:hypothetical protein